MSDSRVLPRRQSASAASRLGQSAAFVIEGLEQRLLFASIGFGTQAQIGNVFQTGQTVQVPLTTSGIDTVQWTVTDFYGNTVASGSNPTTGTVTVQPGTTAKGYFDLHMTGTLAGVTQTTKETTYAMLAPATSATGRPATGTQFSVQTHFANGWSTNLDPLIAKAGIGYVRDEQWWQSIEPSGGGNYTYPPTFTNYMSALNTNGIAIDQELDFYNSNYDAGNFPNDATGQNAFAAYSNALVGHYGSQIQTVEVWNEVNGSFYLPTSDSLATRATNYFNTLKATYNAVKGAHPTVTILGGAGVLTPLGFYHSLFLKGALNYMDGIVIHPYGDTPQTVEEDISTLRAMMLADGGKTVLIYVTEFSKNPVPTNPGQQSEADYLVTMMTSLQSQNVALASWYALYNTGSENTGLLNTPTSAYGIDTPTSAYPAYANYIQQLAGASFNQRWATTDPRTRVYDFTKAGQHVDVAYTSDGSATTVTFNATGTVTVVDLMGNAATYTPSGGVVTINVGPDPIFVKGAISGATENRATQVVADSVLDYVYSNSATQNQAGWYYGSIANSNGAGGSYSTSAFVQDTWKLDSNYGYYWGNATTYNQVTQGGQEPTNGKWAVRRWVSDVSGAVNLAGSISRPDTHPDGVVAEIAVNGTPVYTQTIGPGGSINYSVPLTLNIGDIVDFIITPGAANDQNYDASNFTATITRNANRFPSNIDINNATPAGSGTYNASTGTYTVAGAGNHTSGTTDKFHYMYATASGDFTVIARIVSQTTTNSWASAGVEIRESTAAGSKFVMLGLFGAANGVVLESRATDNTAPAFPRVNGLSAPYWVKLVRSGNTFTGYRSTDGINWTQVLTPVTVTMASNVLVGLQASSYTATVLNTAVFDNVSITGGGFGMMAMRSSSPTAVQSSAGTFSTSQILFTTDSSQEKKRRTLIASK